jgi:SPP1 family phage portal protein
MDIENFKKLVKKHEPGHSSFVKNALIGERYYRDDSDIIYTDKKEDEEGNMMRNADNKIPRNFHGLIVNQKAAYSFTVPPVFDIGEESCNGRIKEMLGDEYVKNCMELCVNAANTSIAWVHYWDSGEGFEWAVLDSKQIVPIWDNSLKRKLVGALRIYDELDGNTGENYTVYEYWTDVECVAYRRRSADTIEEGIGYYEMFQDMEEGEMTASYRHDWKDVPFIPFHNNNIHTDDLKNIKKLIDVYDKVYSGFINDLDDVQEIILVLSGYGGTELNGFLQDLKKYKTIKLDDDEENAGVSTLGIEIPVEARKTVLDITRKAIFEQGQGFDPQPESFGNQSGEALKFMYSLLEMKVGLMETEFRLGFAKLVRAICRCGNMACSVINQTWTRTRIKNDTELSEICKNSLGVISRKTILANHPFVENVQEELKRLEEEEKEQDSYQNAFPKVEDDSSSGDEA